MPKNNLRDFHGESQAVVAPPEWVMQKKVHQNFNVLKF